MKAQVRLTIKKRAALTALLPTLQKLGVAVPLAVAAKILNGSAEVKLNREHDKRLERALSLHDQAVVSVAGLKGTFTVFTVGGFLAKRKAVDKIRQQSPNFKKHALNHQSKPAN